MSNPFSWFRRKQKFLLVVFGVVIMITFTVGGIVTSYQQRHLSSSEGGKDVVVSWRYGEITGDQLTSMRYMHNWTVRFLDMLIFETLQRKGSPKGPGVTRNRQGQIIDPGIPRASQEEDLIRTMVLAQKAADMGMVVTDEAIFEFLYLVSDDKIQHSEFGRILREATNGRVGRDQLFKQLRTELLAQNLQRVIGSGLMAIPPDRAWDYYSRFTRRIKAELLPLRVDDFTSQVKGEPTEEQVRQLYDEGKDRYPDPNSPEPGFRRRKKIAFEYLKVEYEEFLEKAKAEVSEEDVKEYYEENKDDFKMPELPPAKEEANVEPASTANDESGAGKRSDTPGKEKLPTESPEPKGDEKANNQETSKAPLPAETDASTPDVDLVPPENKAGDAKTPDSADGSRVRPVQRVAFVSFNAADKPEDAEASPSVEAGQEKPAEAPSGSAAHETKAQADSAEDTERPPATKGRSDETNRAASDKEAPVGEASKKEKPVKCQPLEEVEDQIRGKIAAPIAEERKKKALEGAKREVDEYYHKLVKWQNMLKAGLDASKPSPLDHEALAEKYELTAGDTPLLDEIEVGDYELGQAWLDDEHGQRLTFPQVAYADGIPLFRAGEVTSNEWGVDFLYWKVDEENWQNGKKEVPKLQEIRDEVVDVWRRREALKLAKAEAEKLAANAKGDKPLKESLNEEQAKKLVETGEFTWMSYGATPMGFGLPGISSVNGVEAPGTGFMEAVYALKPGEIGVAVNQPETAVYLVRVVSESPDENQRRKEFLETGGMYAMISHMTTVREAMREWYEDLQNEMGLKWHRLPEIHRQR